MTSGKRALFGVLIALPAVGGRPDPDLTFLVAADTHLGGDPALDTRNQQMIAQMKRIAGTSFPGTLGGKVATPQALLLAGDLTEDGGDLEWKRFECFYGAGSGLAMPVFENYGNHDHHRDNGVLDRVRQRHGDIFYAFDLGGVRFLSLGEAPDERGLAFAKTQLDAWGQRPVVVYFHLPLLGPWSQNNWFTHGGFRDRLKALLKGRNVLGIFHGHYHAAGTYRWGGCDVYMPGSVKHGWRSFLVVRIQKGHMAVACWNLDAGAWWWWHQKELGVRGRGKSALGSRTLGSVRASPHLRAWGEP